MAPTVNEPFRLSLCPAWFGASSLGGLATTGCEWMPDHEHESHWLEMPDKPDDWRSAVDEDLD